MPIKKVFVDDQNNELEMFINAKGQLCIMVGDADHEIYYSGQIALDKPDAIELFEELQGLITDL